MVATHGEKERCRSIGFDRDADESEEERRGDAGSLGLIMARKALKNVSLPRSSLDGSPAGGGARACFLVPFGSMSMLQQRDWVCWRVYCMSRTVESLARRRPPLHSLH